MEHYLLLGDSNGIYYAGEPKLSTERAGAVRECLAERGRDGLRVQHWQRTKK